MPEFFVGGVAGEGDPVGDAEVDGHLGEAAEEVAAADDGEGRVEVGRQLGHRLEEHVDVLLGGHPPDEHDAVLFRPVATGRVVGGVDAARDGVDAADPGGVFEVAGGPAGRRRDGLDELVGVRSVLPRPLGDPVEQLAGHRRGVLDEILGHEVVGRDDADTASTGDLRQAAADHDVRLDVDDVGLEVVDDGTRVVLHHPRCGEPEPVVQRPARGVQPVDREGGTCMLFPEGAVTAGGGRGDDVHVVAALGEADGESLGEVRGAVHIGRKGVAGDEDFQPSGLVAGLRSGVVARMVVCHGEGRPYRVGSGTEGMAGLG